jgi:sec-independent protein translocase protein TatB
MFDISWAHMAVVAVVALIAIGPKDLPVALRTIGKFVSKAKSMAREFQTNVDDMIRESELDEIKKQIESVSSGSIDRTIEKTVDPQGDLAKAFEPPEFSLDEPEFKKPDQPPPVAADTPAIAPTPIAPTPIATEPMPEAAEAQKPAA